MDALDPVLAPLANLFARIPYPAPLGRAGAALMAAARRQHPYAPLAVALIISYGGAELALWLARQPLYFLWPVFGFVSGNSVQVLSFYSLLAEVFAVLVAGKLVYELHPIDFGPKR